MPWPFDLAPPDPASARPLSDMELQMRSHPWETTAVGPVAHWPFSLKLAVRTLLDCRMPMYLFWGPSHVQFHNDACLPILGDKRGRALGAEAQVVWREIWPVIGPMFERVRQGESVRETDLRMVLERRGFPETCYFSFSYSPLYGDDGKIGGLLATSVETTEKVRAEQALREETRVLELMKQASEALASTLDLAPLLQKITDAATQLAGAEFGAFFYNREDGDGDNSGDDYLLYTLSGAPRAAFEHLGNPRATAVFGPTFRGSAPVRSDDITQDARYGGMAPHHGMPAGHLPVRSYLAASVVSRSGEVIGGLFFGHAQPGMFSARIEELIGAFAVQAAIAIDNARLYDMAQRGAADREYILSSKRAARAEAERHNKMKDEFLAMLAHELRNPLAPITSAAQLLRLPEVNEGLRLKASNIISRQVRHMTELVDDLLDVSRVTRGLVKLENEILDLNKVAIAAVEQARPHIEERSHTLAVDLPSHPVPVEGDRTRLIQVLVNLLNNSAKYTPPGGRISITLTVAGDGATASVAVRDNGSGIDAQLLPHVFDLFTQADRTPDRSQGGLGIGLALVKSIVRMHNGQVAAHSDGTQQGTTMTVTLPLTDAEVGQVPRSGEGGFEARPLSVTIVDDNADAGHSLAVLLRAHGHTVHVHEDASSTLDKADPATQVFILDIGLPDMTGYELARRLHRKPAHAGAVLVALTGYGQQRDRELSQQAGFGYHLVKPVEIGKLTEILERVGS